MPSIKKDEQTIQARLEVNARYEAMGKEALRGLLLKMSEDARPTMERDLSVVIDKYKKERLQRVEEYCEARMNEQEQRRSDAVADRKRSQIIFGCLVSLKELEDLARMELRLGMFSTSLDIWRAVYSASSQLYVEFREQFLLHQKNAGWLKMSEEIEKTFQKLVITNVDQRKTISAIEAGLDDAWSLDDAEFDIFQSLCQLAARFCGANGNLKTLSGIWRESAQETVSGDTGMNDMDLDTSLGSTSSSGSAAFDLLDLDDQELPDMEMGGNLIEIRTELKGLLEYIALGEKEEKELISAATLLVRTACFTRSARYRTKCLPIRHEILKNLNQKELIVRDLDRLALFYLVENELRRRFQNDGYFRLYLWDPVWRLEGEEPYRKFIEEIIRATAAKNGELAVAAFIEKVESRLSSDIAFCAQDGPSATEIDKWIESDGCRLDKEDKKRVMLVRKFTASLRTKPDNTRYGQRDCGSPDDCALPNNEKECGSFPEWDKNM